MSSEVVHDCGHDCCDDRHDPNHDHFLSPHRCPRCTDTRSTPTEGAT